MNQIEMMKMFMQMSGVNIHDKEQVTQFLRNVYLADGRSEEDTNDLIDSVLVMIGLNDDANVYEYKEIFRLKDMMDEAQIPYEFESGNTGGYHLMYVPGNSDQVVCSVIETPMSYGSKEDLLEIQGLMTKKEMQEKDNDVLGYLTAENVFERIQTHYKKYLEGKEEFEKMFAPILQLAQLLQDDNIPFELKRHQLMGLHLTYKSDTNDVSVILTPFSYGRNEGKVEILSKDYDAIGMDPIDVYEYIKRDFEGK